MVIVYLHTVSLSLPGEKTSKEELVEVASSSDSNLVIVRAGLTSLGERIYLSIYLDVYLSIFLSMYLSIYLSIYLSNLSR